MPEKSVVQLSKFLSFVLRHKPDAVGLRLAKDGWVSVNELITKSHLAGTTFTREELLHVVESSEKKRFTLSADGRHIRAAQGHSVAVDLGLSPKQPPSTLYHGTTERFLVSILSGGLKRQERQHVHLSIDEATARQVGQRHGRPVVIEVQAGRMHTNGFQFFLAENGVWLTDHVPPDFLQLLSSRTADSATTSRQPKPST